MPFLDYNRDGHLDLFVSNYAEFGLRKRYLVQEKSLLFFFKTCPQLRPTRTPFDGTVSIALTGTERLPKSAKQWDRERANNYGLTAIAADFDDDDGRTSTWLRLKPESFYS